jgi:predicted permease
LATGLLFGAAPAWRASRGDVMDALRDQTRGASARSGLRSTLVAAQVALSLVLLAGSGLFLRSLVRALDVPLGFTVDGTAVASVNLALARFDEPRAERFYADALERVSALPGVVNAGWTSIVPTAGLMTVEMAIADYRKMPKETLTFYASQVTPGYFPAAGTRVVEGRGFNAADVQGAPLVAVVNEHAARKYWAGRAIGGRIKPDSDNASWATIVGVVEDTTVRQLKEDPVPYVYVPFNQSFETRTPLLDPAHLFVRTSGSVEAILPLLAERIRSVDAAAPVYNVQPFAEHVRGLVMPQRMGATLFGFFSVLALSLASIGIYGVASYASALRTREIGIRMALGANRAAICGLIVRQGLVPVALGLVTGIVLALWTGRLASGLLFDIGPWDPATLAAVGTLLATVALIAILLPARRAARVDPVTALRRE